MNKFSFWQGGKKVDVELVEDEVVLQAESDEGVREFATTVGGEVKDEMNDSPGFMRMSAVQSNPAVEASGTEGQVHQVFRSAYGVAGEDMSESQGESGSPETGASSEQAEYVVTDTFVTKFSPSTKPEEIDDFIEKHNLEVVAKHPDNTYVFQVKSRSPISCIEAANAGHELPHVEQSEPNLMRT